MVLKEMKCKVTHTEAPCTAEIQIHLSPKIRVEERGKFNSTFVFYSTFTHTGKTENNSQSAGTLDTLISSLILRLLCAPLRYGQ